MPSSAPVSQLDEPAPAPAPADAAADADDSQTQDVPDASAGAVDDLLPAQQQQHLAVPGGGEWHETGASYRSATASSPVKPGAADAKAGASSSKRLTAADERDELGESYLAEHDTAQAEQAEDAAPAEEDGDAASGDEADDAAPAEASDEAAPSSAGAPAVLHLSQMDAPPAGATRQGKKPVKAASLPAGKAPKTRGKGTAPELRYEREYYHPEPAGEGSSPAKTQKRATASPSSSAAKEEAEKASAKKRGAKKGGGVAAGKGKGKSSKQADEEQSDEEEEEPPAKKRGANKSGGAARKGKASKEMSDEEESEEAEEEPPLSQHSKRKSSGIKATYAVHDEPEEQDASQESTGGASPKKKQRQSVAKAPAAKSKAASTSKASSSKASSSKASSSKASTSKASPAKGKSSGSSRQREPTVGDDSRDEPNVKKRKRAGAQASDDDLNYPDDEQMEDAEEGEELEDDGDDRDESLDFDDVMAVAALVCELVRPAPSCPSTLARNCLRAFNEIRDDDVKLEAHLSEMAQTIARALGHALCVFLVPLDLKVQLREPAQKELEVLLRTGDWSLESLPIVKGKDCKDQANAARIAASIVLRLTVSAVAFGACSIKERRYGSILDEEAQTIWQYHRFTIHPRKKSSFSRFVVKHLDDGDTELSQDDDDDDRKPTLLSTPPLDSTLKHHATWSANLASFCRVFGLPAPTPPGEATDSATVELLEQWGSPRGSAMMGIGMDEEDDAALAAHLEEKRELDAERLKFFKRHAQQEEPVRFLLSDGKEALGSPQAEA